MLVVILAQIAITFILTNKEEDIASNLSNTLDASWEEELKNPGVMSHYETWVTTYTIFDYCIQNT